ncbi:MAG: hypothetical protein QF797_06280 [Alphaproteobacteria bacterium]|jgi:hypothetical protein|nr:hypothetical protein [Alphaproteobacteria bacterium]MDP6622126.1 hypothetical protein [Alphaproteobacteria bacterium]|tara:strand:- start:418 stop:975 length:558 start_codon:yes stop_codon:yes gene_type:complete
MTEAIPLPDKDREPLAARLFDVFESEHELHRQSEVSEAGESSGVIAFSRLYAYATGARSEDAEVEAALARNDGLRRDFQRLLERAAPYYMPQVAAASTGPITTREGAGCRIRLEPSRAETGQIYVIVELDDKAAQPMTMFVVDGDGQTLRLPLPAARDGVIQILAGEESDLVKALSDLKSEVYLR